MIVTQPQKAKSQILCYLTHQSILTVFDGSRQLKGIWVPPYSVMTYSNTSVIIISVKVGIFNPQDLSAKGREVELAPLFLS